MKIRVILLSLFTLFVTCSLLNAATLTFNTDADIHNLSIGSGDTVVQTGSNLNISGNFTNNGTFSPNTNTVTLTGTGNVLSGNINFYNLTKQVSTSDVITFGAGKMYNVSGTCTLNGADSNLLTLQSSSSNIQWGFNPSGTRSFSYLDVEDSNNTGNPIFVVGTGSVDSGNNTNWRFSPIFVDIDATSGSNDGTSWGDAYISLQSALDNAVSGDKIWIAAGTYTPSSAYGLTDESRYYHFEMVEGVEIYGGFAGTEDHASFNLSHRNFLTNETIFSGDIDGTVGLSNGDCYNVIHNPSSVTLSNAAILDGVTITGGNANATSMYDHRREGGGIYNDWNAAPIIRNCIIKSNYADVSGGGIYFSMPSNSPKLINCLICDNHTGAGDHYNGGGIASEQGSQVALYNCTISGNSAYDGGGIFHAMTTFNMYNCIIWGNTASHQGNDVFVEASAQTNLNNCCYDTTGVYINSGTVTPNAYCIHELPAFFDEDTNDYRLCGNSSCLDVGDNSYCDQTKDIRGLMFGRKLSKTNHTQPGIIDIGAYEYCEGIDPITSFKTYYVDINVEGGNDDGTDWANAFTSFQSALDVASWGDQVWVASGTYYPTKDTLGVATPSDPRTKCFVMIDGVSIYGGFAGTETEVSQRTDFGIGGTHETILSGDFDDNDIVSGKGQTLSFQNVNENAYHVFRLNESLGLTASAVLDGFTISGGCANSYTDDNDKGAGIYNNNNSPTLNQLNVIYNSGGYYSSGIYNNNGSLHISNSNISWNFTDSQGGGIYSPGGDLVIENTTIMYNHTGWSGGGVDLNNCNAEITNVIIAGNYAFGTGGGINVYMNSSPTLTNVTITNNSSGESGDGGGVYLNNNSTATLNNCIIYGNTSVADGNELFINTGCSATLNYCCYNSEGINNNGSFTATNNNINDDPLFVNVENDDYRIYGISPCADVGDNSYNSEEYDYRGVGYPRKLLKTDYTQPGTIDMGAHEYKSDVDPWCPPFFMAKSDGDWSSTFIWYTNNTGGTDPEDYTTAATEYPTADNSSGIVINAYVTISGDADVDIIADQMTVNPGCSLIVYGTLTVADGDGTDLLVEGSLVNDGTISVGTGTVDVNGTFDSQGSFVFTDAGYLNLGGTVSNFALLTKSTGTVTYDGTTSQTIAALDYYILAISGGDKTFADGTTKVAQEIDITDALTLSGSSSDTVTVQVTTPYEWDGTSGNSSATTSRVFNIDASGKTVNISNMTIKGGDISTTGRPTADNFGGGIYIAIGTVNLSSVTVSGSNASGGGGIYNDQGGTLTITSSTISANSASSLGGGIYSNSILSIDSSTISNNSATSNGGGIYTDNTGVLSITSSTIDGNSAGRGGGIYNNSASMTITDSRLSDNSASTEGGGIYNNSGSSIITYSTISGNSASFRGGGICNVASLILTNSTVGNNSATVYGGGICNIYTGALTLTSSTVSGNNAPSGSGVYVNSFDPSYHAYLYSTNSIIAYNYLSDETGYSDVVYVSGTIYGNYNISSYVDWGVGTTGNITYTYGSGGYGDILFASYTDLTSTIHEPVLADNGGSTYTVAITAGSIASGAGTRTGSYDDDGTTKYVFSSDGNTWRSVEDGTEVTASVSEITTDQRGVTRNASVPIVGSYYELFTPSTQAYSVVFSEVEPYQMGVAWTRGDGNNCAVFMKENVSKENTKNNSYTNRKNITLARDLDTATPENTVTYDADAKFGSGDEIGSTGWFCVYNGSDSTVTVTDLDYYTSYVIHVCEYNGNAGAEIYDTDSAVDNPNSRTTAIPPMYYRSVASGNWSETATWQGSLDGSTWINALEAPNDSSLGITIRSENYVSVNADISIDQTVIENTATLTVTNGHVLSLENGEGTDLMIAGSLVNNGTINISENTDVVYAGNSNTVIPLSYYNLTLGQATKKNSGKNVSLNKTKALSLKNSKANVKDSREAKSGVYTLSGNTTVLGNFTINTAASLSVGEYDLTVSGATDNNGEIGIATGTFDANGTFDASGGMITFTGAGNLYLGNTVTSLGTFTAGSGNVYYDRSDDQSISVCTYYNLYTSGSGTKTLNGDIDVDGNLTIAENTTFASNDSNITLAGNWTNNGGYIAGSNIVIFAGSGAQSIAGTNNFYDLTISNSGTGSVDASSGTLSVANDLSVTDGIFLSASDYENVIIGVNGTLQLSGDITVSGDWNNAGTFEPDSHMVTLDGGNQSVLGNTTFYDLKKNVTSTATLTFEHSDTTIVTHHLDLQGAEDNLLSLRSDSDGNQWILDVPAAKDASCTIGWLDIKDSDNIGEEIQAHHTHSIDSGNNIGWNFDYKPYVSTQAVTEIMHFSATGNGTITDIGHPTPTQYGVCWSTEVNPTIDDTSDYKTEEGAISVAGAFTSEMTGLDEGTTYYVRAYATNTFGTGYGSEVSFTTYAMPDFVYNSTTYEDGDSVSVSTNEDSTLTFILQTNDENEGETFSWDYSNVTHGSVNISNVRLIQSSGKFSTKGTGSMETKQITFTPDEDYNGDATFTIEVGDGVSTDVSTLTFNVTINPVNDPPVCIVAPVISGEFYVGQNISVSTGTWKDEKDVDHTTTDYTFNPTYTYQWQRSDDGDNFINIVDSIYSSLVIPDTYYDKQLRCIVTCTDDGEGTPSHQSASAYSDTVTVLNSPPVFVYDGKEYNSGDSIAVNTNEDTYLIFGLIAKDNNASQIFTWNCPHVTNGTVTIVDPPKSSKTTQPKQITFTPNEDYNGDALFTITVDDGISKDKSYLTFNVTVNPINDKPICVVPPVVSGHLQVNDTLHVTNGTWIDEKDVNGTSYTWNFTYTYQWQKSLDGVTFANVTDSTRNSFITPDDFYGYYVRCQVTCTDDGYGTPATSDSTIGSNSLHIINTAPEFVYDGTTYASGSSIDIDAARNTDLVFNLMVHDDNAGETITWNDRDVTHGSVSIENIPMKDPTEVTKQITFTPEENYMGYAGFTISVNDNVSDAISTLEFDITIKPYNVYVDDDWTGYSYGEIVQDTLVFGQNAFLIVNNAVNGVASTGIIHVFDGTYDDGILIDKSLTMTTSDEAIITLTADLDYALSIAEDDVTVTGFVFQDVENAVTAIGENITVTDCWFENCTNGVVNTGFDDVDATRNWWGDLHGPSNTTNPNYAITTGSVVSDYVTFFPWNATVTVTPEREFVTVYEPNAKLTIIAVSDVIQTGIDAAVDGNIVEVTDGTYTEDLTVDKSITLRSENGTDVTTIQQIDGVGITVEEHAGGFTLGGTDVGFTILAGNNTTQVIRIEDGPSNVSIIENIIDIEGYAFEAISINSVGVDSLTVQDNSISCDNGDSGLWLPNSSNALIVDNVFECKGFPISGWAIHLSGNTDPTVSGNSINNFNIGLSLSCGIGFTGGEITENDISNCSHNMYINQWSPSGVFGMMQNVSFTENDIATDQVAIYIGDGTYIDASTFTIQYNNFTSPLVKSNDNSTKYKKEVRVIKDRTTKQNDHLYGFTVEEMKLSNYGIYNAHTTEIVTAEDNWWNDQDGPYHNPDNTDTDGMNVSDNVDYRPWAIGNPAIDNIDHLMNLTITSPGSVDSVTSTTPIPFEVDFNEVVHKFDKDTEIQITGGYINTPSITNAGNGLYTFDLIPSMDTAQMTVSVAAQAAEDIAGNYNQAADITITYDAVIAKYVITVTPTSPYVDHFFDITLEAVDMYNYRDTDYNGLAMLENNHADFVNLINFMNLKDGFSEVTSAGMSSQATDDLSITVMECLSFNYESVLDSIIIQQSPIYPPTGHDGIGDPVVYDVPNDQGGWIELDYGLSPNDPFHPNPVLPYITGYLVERNTEPDTSGTWETYVQIGCYNPSASGNATALIPVPEEDTPYPYRMTSYLVPSTDNKNNATSKEILRKGKPEITFVTGVIKDQATYISSYVYCGSAAGQDNIPAYADLKVYLEGAYLADGTMNTDLYDAGLLPADAPSNAVDRITLELRSSIEGETLKTTDAYLMADGSVVNTDGGNSLPFFYTTGEHYYIVIHHRNHLGVITAGTYSFGDTEAGATEIDLTVMNSVHLNGLKEVEPGVYAMYDGDANHSEFVNVSDAYDLIDSYGTTGYLGSDLNLSGYVNVNDAYELIANFGMGTSIPGEKLGGKDQNVQFNVPASSATNELECTLEIKNIQIIAGLSYSFDVYITRNTENGSALGHLAFLSETWYSDLIFDYNSEALANPVVSGLDPMVKETIITAPSLGKLSVNLVDGGTGIPTSETKLMTVTFDVTDASAISQLSWNTTDTGIISESSLQFNVNDGTLSLLGSDNSTHSIELAAFAAMYCPGSENVKLNWSIANELDVKGFNIYRSENKDLISAGRNINSTFIQTADTKTAPQNYTYIDVVADVNTAHHYWLEVVDFGGISTFHGPFVYTPGDIDGDNKPDLIVETKLIGNFPNPAISSTKIKFQVKGLVVDQNATISVYNIRGELVKTLKGKNGVATLNTSDLGQGVYFYSLINEGTREIKKLIIIK